MLDLLAAGLSGGRATREIPRDPEEETGLSQVFIAFDPAMIGSTADIDRLADTVIDHVRGNGEVRYPGERVLQERTRSMREGVPVEESVWREISGM